MWSYYGAKTNLIKFYPPPKYDMIIEPFAGTGRYALEYWEKDVLLVDKFKIIIDIWLFLKDCSEKDILRLPILKAGDSVDKYNYYCQAQRNLIGFMAGYGLTHPANKTSKEFEVRNRMEATIKSIAANIHKIKHWEFRCGCYSEIDNLPATYFIDAPYQVGGQNYSHSSKKIDFQNLAEFCKTRNGQTIVCENTKADWLPFKPMRQIQGAKGKSVEAIWSNEATNYDNVQQKLIL